MRCLSSTVQSNMKIEQNFIVSILKSVICKNLHFTCLHSHAFHLPPPFCFKLFVKSVQLHKNAQPPTLKEQDGRFIHPPSAFVLNEKKIIEQQSYKQANKNQMIYFGCMELTCQLKTCRAPVQFFFSLYSWHNH